MELCGYWYICFLLRVYNVDPDCSPHGVELTSDQRGLLHTVPSLMDTCFFPAGEVSLINSLVVGLFLESMIFGVFATTSAMGTWCLLTESHSRNHLWRNRMLLTLNIVMLTLALAVNSHPQPRSSRRAIKG